MSESDRLDIPPGLRTAVQQAVKTAVTEALADIDLASLQRCQEQLQECSHKLAEMTQNFRLYKEIADQRAERLVRTQNQVEELNGRVTQLQTDIALLLSAVENKDAENG